jgi:hypothetical protein
MSDVPPHDLNRVRIPIDCVLCVVHTVLLSICFVILRCICPQLDLCLQLAHPLPPPPIQNLYLQFLPKPLNLNLTFHLKLGQTPTRQCPLP